MCLLRSVWAIRRFCRDALKNGIDKIRNFNESVLRVLSIAENLIDFACNFVLHRLDYYVPRYLDQKLQELNLVVKFWWLIGEIIPEFFKLLLSTLLSMVLIPLKYGI